MSEKKVHRTQIRVLYADTDAGGVVYNASYLRYFELGRTELMRDWVCPYREIEAMGYILPVTEAWARYKAPAFYDDLLTVETSIIEVGRLKCKFHFRILRQEPDGTSRLLVKGFTVHAAVTREGKLTRLPSEIIDKIASYCSQESDSQES